VAFDLRSDGTVEGRRGGGGLVTAVSDVLGQVGGEWVAAAMTEGDREEAGRSPEGLIDAASEVKYALRYLTFPAEVYERSYDVVSNRILWFAHHGLWDLPRVPSFGSDTERAWRDYAAVNRAFAEALDASEGDPAFLVQDYHLSLVPRMLRARRPHALIAHFSHTAFAGPTYLRVLPPAIRVELLEGMLGADVLGFHDERWAEAFLLCCRDLEGARVDLRRRTVELDGRRSAVRVYPISIDVPALRERARRGDVAARRRELRRWRGDARLLLRVDRLEPAKNVLRGFLAFEELLVRHPEWRDRVRFLALLNPSRPTVPEYRAYADECERAVERINAAHGTSGWTPIEMAVEDDHARSVAGYLEYDVLLVNPMADGMNLVAMEGPALNRRHGVLVLSSQAGAFERLGRHALGVHPFDVGETAEAMHEALSMPAEERARRATALRRTVGRLDPAGWAMDQVGDLERFAADRR
jgi:trehalose 6-phosphate synthase